MVKAPSPARKTPGYDPEKRADDLKRRFARVSNRALGRGRGAGVFRSPAAKSHTPVRPPSVWMTLLAVAAVCGVAVSLL